MPEPVQGTRRFFAHNRSQQRNRQEAHAQPPDSPQDTEAPAWLSMRLPPFPCQTIGAAALKVAPQRRGQHAEEERKTARGGGLFSPRVERRETTAEVGRKIPRPPSTVHCPAPGLVIILPPSSCRAGSNQSKIFPVVSGRTLLVRRAVAQAVSTSRRLRACRGAPVGVAGLWRVRQDDAERGQTDSDGLD